MCISLYQGCVHSCTAGARAALCRIIIEMYWNWGWADQCRVACIFKASMLYSRPTSCSMPSYHRYVCVFQDMLYVWNMMCLCVCCCHSHRNWGPRNSFQRFTTAKPLKNLKLTLNNYEYGCTFWHALLKWSLFLFFSKAEELQSEFRNQFALFHFKKMWKKRTLNYPHTCIKDTQSEIMTLWTYISVCFTVYQRFKRWRLINKLAKIWVDA
jgi:hypothetical protein